MSPVVFWFRVRKHDKHGQEVDPGVFGAGKTTDDYLGQYLLGLLPSPVMAREIKRELCGGLGLNHHNADLYANKHASDPYDNDDVVDMHKVGIKKDHPLLLVVDKKHSHHHHHDGGDYWNGSTQSTGNTQSTFTKRLRCKGTCDWTPWPESIQHMTEGEILWTDGRLDRAVANEMAYMAQRKDAYGQVIAQGLASRLYVDLLD